MHGQQNIKFEYSEEVYFCVMVLHTEMEQEHGTGA
jgi:hypothetical protein